MGGLARGVTYGTRLWMEAQLGGPGVRQRYLSMVEASSTLCKVVAPAWALLLLSVTDRFESIFLSGGLLFLALLAVTRARAPLFASPNPISLSRCGGKKPIGATPHTSWSKALATPCGRRCLSPAP